MNKISISNIGVVHGLFIDYTVDGCSDSLVFGDLSNNEESVDKLITLLKQYNDLDLDSLSEIIEDFVCDQGIPKTAIEYSKNKTPLMNPKVSEVIKQ